MKAEQKTINDFECSENEIHLNRIQGKFNLKDLAHIPRALHPNQKITVDLTGTKYSIIKEVCSDILHWRTVTKQSELTSQTPWNILWDDGYLIEDDLRKLGRFQTINHFPGSYFLGKKNCLFDKLNKLQKLCPEDYNFFPTTYLVPSQYEFLRNVAAAQTSNNFRKVFIVKPEASCQGKGIFLTDNIEKDIDLTVRYVVQDYIARPLLVEGMKFDLRIYVLLKSVKPLKIYIYREGLARLATEKFQAPSKGNLRARFMHLTNYAVNKKNPAFQAPDVDTGLGDSGHKRSISSIMKLIENLGGNADSLWNDIENVAIKTICSIQPYLSHIYNVCRPNDERKDCCFELFGFDMLIDESLKPWLLEVNHTPSFTTDSPLDHLIKKHLILDTLLLVSARKDQERVGAYERIYPSKTRTKATFEGYMITAQNIWNAFISGKRKASASTSHLPSSLSPISTVTVPQKGHHIRVISSFASPQASKEEEKGKLFIRSIASPKRVEGEFKRSKSASSTYRKDLIEARNIGLKIDFYLNRYNNIQRDSESRLKSRDHSNDTKFSHSITNVDLDNQLLKQSRDLKMLKLHTNVNTGRQRPLYQISQLEIAKPVPVPSDIFKKSVNFMKRYKENLGLASSSSYRREYIKIKTFDFKEPFNYI